MKIEEMEAISNAGTGDPFRFFGLHPLSVEKGGKVTASLLFRTFQPHASHVRLLPDKGRPIEVPKVHEGGIFEVVLSRRTKPFPYTLEITPHQGPAYTSADPYAFESQLSDFDLQLWGEGTHHHAYRWMGAHPRHIDGVDGTLFVVSAPSATRVSVIGSFNDWDGRRHCMRRHHDQGLWELFIPMVGEGDLYKFELLSPAAQAPLKKADPYARFAELRPGTASRIFSSSYTWKDADWLKARPTTPHHTSPISVYEVHVGSWRRDPSDPGRFLSWQELAGQLIPYVKDLGFTHIELMPIAEHPYDPSWGYQVTGYFAPTSRFGSPDDFRDFVDQCHREGIGVILDWVPAHFTKDEHGLRRFDGTALFEHEDPRKGEHLDWGTNIFNFSRTEVLNFLLCNAIYWIEEFHIDGLRVDAVASMLYLDYSRKEGEWIANHHGGRENLEAIHFLQEFNKVVHGHFPGVLTFAEESTSWGGVSREVHHGGLGFDFKWNMGWMNDTLEYIQRDPIHRKFHQQELTFSMIYAFSESFILPLSHDEVVHMKQALLTKMPGDDWQRFANLRLLFSYMWGHPGKKLLFMGGEFGQWAEWNHAQSLDWHLLQWEPHRGIQNLVRDLNRLYTSEPAMSALDHSWEGFQWVDMSDADHSLISFIRRSKKSGEELVFVCNFTPTVLKTYSVGAPAEGTYKVLLNSDSSHYGGSNAGDATVLAEATPWQHQPAKLTMTVPPLATVILKRI